MTNLVPFDKFRPGNVKKAYEYLHYLSKMNPGAIVKYRDELTNLHLNSKIQQS
jgi:hypothetical protein